MRRFRLSGWQRIGIVLSVLWAIGVLLYGWQEWSGLSSSNDKLFYDCLFAPHTDSSEAICKQKAAALRNASMRVSRENLAARLVPIPIVWLLVYIVVWTARWIRRGFQPST
jgi:hypothetical protein